MPNSDETIKAFFDALLQPAKPTQNAWWDSPITVGGSVLQNTGPASLGGSERGTQSSYISLGSPAQALSDLIGGFSMGRGDLGTAGANLGSNQSNNQGGWNFSGALQSGLPGAVGGFLGGGLPGAALGFAGPFTGQLGQNVSQAIFGQPAPAFANSLQGLGLSPQTSQAAFQGLASLAGIVGGPLGALAVQAANLAAAIAQGQPVAANIAALMTAIPAGMLGPLGQLAANVVNPALAGALNYGYQGITTGLNPTSNQAWGAQDIANMTPGALATTNFSPSDVLDAYTGVSMLANDKAANYGAFEPAWEGRTSQLQNYTPAQQQAMQTQEYTNSLIQAGYDPSWAGFLGDYSAQFAQENADKGWFDFSDTSGVGPAPGGTGTDTGWGDSGDGSSSGDGGYGGGGESGASASGGASSDGGTD